MASSSAYKDSLTQAILDLPLHKTLGIRLISQSLQEATSLPSASLSTARIAISSAPLHLSLVGTLHGGISTLLIDIACLLAMVPTLADGQSAATLSSSFQMLNAVVVPAEGTVWEVEGRVLRRGKNVGFCEGEVLCEGKVLAKGAVTKTVVAAPKHSKL